MKMLNCRLVENTVWNLILDSVSDSVQKLASVSVWFLVRGSVRNIILGSFLNLTFESTKDCIDEDVIHQ